MFVEHANNVYHWLVRVISLSILCSFLRKVPIIFVWVSSAGSVRYKEVVPESIVWTQGQREVHWTSKVCLGIAPRGGLIEGANWTVLTHLRPKLKYTIPLRLALTRVLLWHRWKAIAWASHSETIRRWTLRSSARPRSTKLWTQKPASWVFGSQSHCWASSLLFLLSRSKDLLNISGLISGSRRRPFRALFGSRHPLPKSLQNK